MNYDNPQNIKSVLTTVGTENPWYEAYILKKTIKICDLCQRELSLWESYSISEDSICCSVCKEECRRENERLALEERHSEMKEGKSFIIVSRPSSISLKVSPITIIVENTTSNKRYEALLSIGDYKEILVKNHNKYIIKAYISPNDHIEELNLYIEEGESVYIEVQPLAHSSTLEHKSRAPNERINCKIIKREVAKDGIIHTFSSLELQTTYI